MRLLTSIILVFFTTHLFAQNVGIGNINPLMKLHVTKADSALLLLENTQPLATDISNALYFKTGTSFSYTGGIKTIGQGTNTARLGLFTFASSNPNNLKERLSITDAGLVGIGTSTPASQLTIVAATNTSGLELTDGNKRLQAYVNTNGANIGVDQGLFGLATTGSLRLLVDSLGNVGIGTNSYTTAHLHVTRGINAPFGTAQFDGTTNASHFNYGTGEETYIRGGKATSQVIINDVSSGNVRLAEGGGNVGIGTAFPTYSLDVSGTVRTTDKATFGSTIQISGGSPGTNKILTSTDNVGNAVWSLPSAYNTGFRVFESSSKTIFSGNGGYLTFSSAASGTNAFDDGGNFDNSSNGYIAPANGVYQFNADINFNPITASGGGYIELDAVTPSSNYTFARSTVNVKSGDITPRTLNLSFITKLTAGQKVYIYVFNSLVGTDITTQNVGGSQTTFSGARLY